MYLGNYYFTLGFRGSFRIVTKLSPNYPTPLLHHPTSPTTTTPILFIGRDLLGNRFDTDMGGLRQFLLDPIIFGVIKVGQPLAQDQKTE